MLTSTVLVLINDLKADGLSQLAKMYLSYMFSKHILVSLFLLNFKLSNLNSPKIGSTEIEVTIMICLTFSIVRFSSTFYADVDYNREYLRMTLQLVFSKFK